MQPGEVLRANGEKHKAGNGAKGRVPRRWARPNTDESARRQTDVGRGGARGSDETSASASERQGGLDGGRREEPARREVMAELGEALLGGLARGVDGDDAPAAATGAAQDVGTEGVLMQAGPVESA